MLIAEFQYLDICGFLPVAAGIRPVSSALSQAKLRGRGMNGLVMATQTDEGGKMPILASSLGANHVTTQVNSEIIHSTRRLL